MSVVADTDGGKPVPHPLLAAAAMGALALASCQTAQHRHDFVLVAGGTQQPVHVWLQPTDQGPGGLWIDSLLFPIEFLASSWVCLEATWRDDVAIAWGPLGWLATALPFCSARYYGDATKARMPIKPWAPDPQPIRVPVSREELAAIVAAASPEQRCQAFDQAVSQRLAAGTRESELRLDRSFWERRIRPALRAVELPEGQPPR